MSLEIELTEEAIRDLAEARSWYDAQRAGLGLEFIAACEAAYERIAENPQQFLMVHKRTRRALLRRFPYSVPFVAEADRIVILGVLHCKRHPKLLRRRAR
jgi:toxin ParE1/3/4